MRGVCDGNAPMAEVGMGVKRDHAHDSDFRVVLPGLGRRSGRRGVENNRGCSLLEKLLGAFGAGLANSWLCGGARNVISWVMRDAA